MRTSTFTFNGTTFHYDRAGNGEPLLFIHAGICDRRMWDEQLAFFSETYEVIRYDMRGFGETAVSLENFSHVDDLHALFEHWQIEQAHLVGCSKGGMVSMDFALTNPERVRSLTMVCSNPTGFNFEGEPPPEWDDLIAAFDGGDLEKANELEIRFWVDGWQHRPPNAAPQHIRELVRDMNMIALLNDKIPHGIEQTGFKAVARIHELKQPLLVMLGKYDDDDLAKAGHYMAKQHGDADVVTLDAAHLPNMEQPQIFNKHLLNFLKQL